MDDALLRKTVAFTQHWISWKFITNIFNSDVCISISFQYIKNPLSKKVFVIEARDRLDDSL